MKINVVDIKKTIAALIAALGVIVSEVALNGTVQHYISVAISVLGAIAVYITPNGSTPVGEHETTTVLGRTQ